MSHSMYMQTVLLEEKEPLVIFSVILNIILKMIIGDKFPLIDMSLDFFFIRSTVGFNVEKYFT